MGILLAGVLRIEGIVRWREHPFMEHLTLSNKTVAILATLVLSCKYLLTH